MAAFPQPETPESADRRAWPWTRELEPWALQDLRKNHEQALYAYGELDILVLMWQLRDFQAGLVGRCQSCAADPTVMTDPAIFTETYKQPSRHFCADCLGTTFEGGWKAQLLRPVLWNANDEEVAPNARGVTVRRDATIQLPAGVSMMKGDYVTRLDSTHWQIGTTDSTNMHVGFGFPSGFAESAIGSAQVRVERMDTKADVSVLLPPGELVVAEVLRSYNAHVPPDNTEFDVIRGPIT